MSTPTPGGPNVGVDQVFDGFVDEIRFSEQRGFYDAAITVAIETDTPNAVIRYTTDGSKPTEENGIVYTVPIHVSTTTPLRAYAIKDGLISSDVVTHTFVYLDDVIRQTGEGLPETWGLFPFGSTEAQQGSPVPANYEMDQQVVNDIRYRDTIKDDLKSLPTISLTINPDDLWDSESGIYSNSTKRGVEWERAGSAEFFDSNNHTLFQIDAGLRVHGGFGRRPSGTAKHSFRLFFRGTYGDTKLNYPLFGEGEVDTFDTLILRANYNYSWSRGNRGGEQTGADYTMVTDRWAAETQEEMGGLTSNGMFVHLYVNGLYWGVYNPVERPDASFLAQHNGGRKEDYDVMSHGGLVDGTQDEWNRLIAAARDRDYETVSQLVDMDNFIDYLILNQYGGNIDWPQNNWYASRKRSEGEKWQFHSWDAEFFFKGLNTNRITDFQRQGPGIILEGLRRNDEFKIAMADRIYKHMFNDGVLTPAANIARHDELAKIVDRAVVGESARWGDGWMDHVEPARTRDDDWLPRIAELNEVYFPQRGDIVIDRYTRSGFYPATAPPVLEQRGGTIEANFELPISNPNEAGTIYYTTDGSDPRLPGGEINPSASQITSDSLRVPGTQTLRLRVLNGDEWSALENVEFQLAGDLDRNGTIEPSDVDVICFAIGQRDLDFDLDHDGDVDLRDLETFLASIGSVIGDSNLDGTFDSTDFVQVFQANVFEKDKIATWATGDWNCDGKFGSSDFVYAFASGSYVAN
ncbi:MAG: chitobiase/beta-hexosaminidase C-terminal domain-containing protein [Planctomycetales bacterium]|nr:chitobiase/beta-hexosaminidase C-terminal domain-containing protein [Planctomycetales bacterium]